jgi:hypothetical protein
MYIADEGIRFELNPGPNRDENGKALLYAIPDTSRKCSLELYAKDAEQRRLISAVHLKTALDAFRDEAGLLLSRGYRVMTPFGSFALKLKVKGHFTDRNKVKGTDIEVDGIEFTPNKEFLDLAKDNIHTPRKKRQVSTQEILNSPEALKALIDRIIENNGYVTVRTFKEYSGLKIDTARNYLNTLCQGDQPLLKQFKVGRTFIYKLRQQSNPE